MRAILAGIADIGAAEAAAPVDAFMRGQMQAGETPEGVPWPERKKGGGRGLRGAAGAYEQRVSGNTIVMRVRGRYAFHHFGAGYSPERRQLPLGRMPKKLGNAIRLGLVEAFTAKTKAGKRGYKAFKGRMRAAKGTR
jgi:hypothetical protein